MSRYIGVQPTDQLVSYRTVAEFSAQANQTDFALDYVPGSIDVYVNGVLQLQSDYIAADGDIISFYSPLTINDKVVFVNYGSIRQIFNAQTNKVDSRDPNANDGLNFGYDIGSTWTNVTTGDTFICTNNTVGAAVWINTTKTNNLFI